MRVTKLTNSIQPYEWGSRTLIPEYLGIANTAQQPMAELWMGAHPKSPSRVQMDEKQEPLNAVIERSPEATLGASVAASYGTRLPFLLKVLAAARGLSIQAHPNLEQARAGFEREQDAGIAIDAASRNYRDDNHKPEIICALGEFWALRGFRPITEIVEEFERPEFGILEDHVAALSGGDASADGESATDANSGALRRFFEAIMRSEGDERNTLIAGARRYARSRIGKDRTDRYSWVLELHDQFGDDIGILAPLYLNCIRLEPKEALFLPAGVLHAYLRGIGIELMANSDNVLRGGCTNKHVDVDELLSVLSFEAGEAEVLSGTQVSPIETVYPSAASEFQLSRLEISEPAPRVLETGNSPEILLCVDGNLSMDDAQGPPVTVRRGEAVFVPAEVAQLSIRGTGTAYRARVPVS